MVLLKKLLLNQLLILLLLVMGLWLFVVPANAAINDQIHFQGKVVNSDGTNVSNGDYSFTFTIYDAATVGTNLWTETKTITVTDGIFATDLGSVTDLPGSIDFNSDSLYLGVNFNSDGEMSPRIRLTAVPYAFNAEMVNGLTVTDTDGTLTIPNATIAFSGDNDVTLTSTGATTLTLPTTGTLATLAGVETFSNKTIDSGGLTVASTGWIGLGSSAANITFTDATTDVISILNANVGIGTTTVNAPLHVAGVGIFGGSAGGNQAIVGYANNATIRLGNNFYNTSSWTGGTGGTSFSILPDDSAITSGTLEGLVFGQTFDPTSGTAKYIGTSIEPTINQTGSATGDYTALQVNAIETAATGTNKLLADFQTNSTSRMVLTSVGNLGIGTTIPGSKLDVAGDIKAPTATFSATYAGGTALTLNAGPTATAEILSWQSSTGTVLGVINSAGNLGIGTSMAANFKLEIAGDIGPEANNTRSLGSDTKRWTNIHTSQLCLAGDCQTAWPVGGGGSSNWRYNLGTISVVNDTVDLLVGANATASAKFAVLNLNNGTPVASISSGLDGNSMFMTANGTLSTERRQSITIGNSSTYNTSGNILLHPNGTGNVGIGTTQPVTKLHISDATNPALAIIDTTNVTSTVLQSLDASGLVGTSTSHSFAIITASQTRMAFDSTGNTGIGTTSSLDSKLEIYSGDTTRALQIIGDSVTTGEVIDVSADGLTTGYAMNLSTTSNNLSTGGLVDLDWTPSAVATASGDLFRINLGAHADLTGNIFALYDSGSSIFLASTTKITSSVPHEFTASGDVSIAYDVVFTNQTASEIQSYGPLTIKSGESYENLDLTLDPSGTGAVVVADGSDFELYADQKVTFDVDDGGNSYMAFDNTNNWIEVFSDGSERFRFTASGQNESNGALTTTLSDVAENYPTMNDALSPGDVVMITDQGIDAPAAAIVDTADSEHRQQVLGVVSSKPGILLGGSSFLSDICEAVTASASGKLIQREALLKTEYKQLKLVEFESDTQNSTDSATLRNDLETQIGIDLTAMSLEELETAVPATTIKTVDDRINSCEAIKQVPVALAGRVPVKFDYSQGHVKPGDLLSVSASKPGFVSKATTAGWVIGRALAPSTNDSETVMMFANITWYGGGDSIASLGQVLGTSDDVSLNPELNELLSTSTINGKQFIVSSTNLSVFGTMTAETLAATNKILTGMLSIGGTNNEITTVNGSTLQLQSAFGAGNIEAFNKKLVFTSEGSVIAEDQITAKRFAASDDARGSVYATSNRIKVDKQWKSAPASITLTPEYRADVWVTDITKDGFYINAEPVSANKRIYWWAVW